MNFTEMSFSNICPDNYYVNFSENINYVEEKLLIFSILATDFIFTIIYYGLEYYFNNTLHVNLCLISLYVLYKLQQIHLLLQKNQNSEKN